MTENNNTSTKHAIKLAFYDKITQLSINKIIPTKTIPDGMQANRKFNQILASIKEVGIIEPLVVTTNGKSRQQYILLDGHVRLEILKTLGICEVQCLISSDDESYTYNKYISRMAPIQEHEMIKKAVKRGVSEEKIAKALNMDVTTIIKRRNLLKGICQEAADLLKDKMVPAGTFSILRKMKSYRQIEAATFMNDAGLYSVPYAQAILGGTPADQLVDKENPKKITGLSDEQMTRMESEMANLQREYQLIEESYGSDVLNFTLAKGYLGSLLGNANVVRYLAKQHPEILSEFQKITEITSLEK